MRKEKVAGARRVLRMAIYKCGSAATVGPADGSKDSGGYPADRRPAATGEGGSAATVARSATATLPAGGYLAGANDAGVT